MKVTKNPSDKFTAKLFDTLCFRFSHIHLGWVGRKVGGHMYNKIKNCIQIFQTMATHAAGRTIKRKVGRATDHQPPPCRARGEARRSLKCAAFTSVVASL